HLLERHVSSHPEDEEGHLLLASAYLGAAGADIYTTYDSFKEILFDKSLNDRLWHQSKSGSNLYFNSFESENDGVAAGPVGNLAKDLNRFLFNFLRITNLLHRFIKIEKSKWPLLDVALEHLKKTTPTRDIQLYKV